MTNDRRTFIVAELSANHRQIKEVAIDSIKAAKDAGADAIKLQTYTPDTMTVNSDDDYFRNILNGTAWEGKTLYELYQEAHTPWEWHQDLFDLADSLGIVCFSTPFDTSAVDFLEELNNPLFKISSFEITDLPLIEYVASKKKPILISTGIATKSDISDALNCCQKAGNNDVTLLKCTSSYPAPLEEANLRTMVDMKKTFGVKIGLSDHTLGTDVAIAAVALGARVIEKHFILDRKLGGPDVSFSIEPDEFKSLVESIRNVEKSLGKIQYTLSEKQKSAREFGRSLFVIKNIEKGEKITAKNIKSIRPGNGLPPRYYKEVLGKKAKTSLSQNTPLKWEDIAE